MDSIADVVRRSELLRGIHEQHTKEEPMQYRQGDVFIERIGKLPKGLKQHKRDGSRIVLAYGEVTGHAHAIAEETAESFVGENGEIFLSVDAPAEVKHEEHSTITLPIGTYRVTRQREYTPGEIRNVAD